MSDVVPIVKDTDILDVFTKVKNISLENIRLVNKMKFNKFLKLII